MQYQKGIHYSYEIESAILGVCLLEKTAIGRTYGIVEADSFYGSGNKEAYGYIREMFETGIPIDLLTAVDFVMNVKKVLEIDSIPVALFLAKKTNEVVSAAHVEYHCYILKRMWIERRLIFITHGGLQLDGDLKDQMSRLYSELSHLNNFSTKKDWYDMEDLMVGLYQHMDEMQKSSGMGVTTGINSLDRENGGFHPGQMIILGARPSVGKSAFIGQMAIGMAKKGVKVGIISLEMGNNEVAARLAAIDTDTDFNLIYRNLIRDEQQKDVWYERVNKHTSRLPIYVTDKTGVNINEIRAKASKLVSKQNLDFLIIDYLQLVTPVEGVKGKSRNRENEVSEISRGVKIMAKELNIPAMVLCQLNREVTKRTGASRYPHLSDLRESGSLEQDADVVMFLHRDWMSGEQFMTDENGQSTEFDADLIVRKWRNGASNLHIKMEFIPAKMMFREKRNQFHHIAPEESRTSDNDEPF